MHREISLQPEPSSVRRARDFMRWSLADAGATDDGAIDIVVSELVTNAIVHGAAPIALHVWPRPGHIRVGVSDGSTVPPARRAAGTTDRTGRGLTIIERLAMQWGSDPLGRGKLTWADIAYC